MEKKLDGLVALFTQPENVRASSAMSEGPQIGRSSSHLEQQNLLLPSPSNSRDRGHRAESLQSDFSPAPQQNSPIESSNGRDANHHENADQDETLRQKAPTPQTLIANGRALGDGFANGLVDNVQAEILLNEFRTMTDFFPFVAVSSSATAQKVSSGKPMLFLAILMTASCGNRPLQITLEEQFRQELATKIILHAQRSLEHLQSILVYLAW